MKKNVEAVVSAMGALLSIMVDLVKFIKELGGEIGADIYRLAQPDGQKTLHQIAELIVDAGKKDKNTFRIIVDYSKSLPEMILAGKYYDWVNNDITTEHFPITGQGKQKVIVELLHFNCHFSRGNEVLAEINKLGYRPATIAELLALGATYPEQQKQFPIAAFGSLWLGRYGNRGVPCLGWYGSERCLGLDCLEDGWDGRWRFVVVRQVSNS